VTRLAFIQCTTFSGVECTVFTGCVRDLVVRMLVAVGCLGGRVGTAFSSLEVWRCTRIELTGPW